MAAAGRRKIVTLDDRVDVLKRIDNGESCRIIAAAVNNYYCGKSQINRIRSDGAAILKEWEIGARYDLTYLSLKYIKTICSGLLPVHRLRYYIYIVFSFSIHCNLGTKFMYNCTR